jgi:cytochrome c556
MRWTGKIIAILLFCILGSSYVCADEAGEAAQQYRRALFDSIVWNFMPMSEMARGKRPYDAAEVKKRALTVSYLSLLLDEGFPKGSGASAGTTDALDAIWENPEDFAGKLRDFRVEANALRKVAEQSDQASFNEQFKRLSGACKGCHDKYKAD